MSISSNSLVQRNMQAILPEMTANKHARAALFTPESLDRFDTHSVQVDANDPRLALTPEQMAIERKANAKQAEQNASIAKVLRDPGAYKKELEGRFESQKLLTPDDPYQFEFGDYGVPVLQDIDQHLDAEIEKLNGKLGRDLKGSGERTGIGAALSAVGTLFNPFHWIADKNKELGVEFLKELQADVRGHIDNSSISYRRMQELTVYSATALGHFDDEDLSLRDRSMLMIDRHLLGKESGDIEEEYRRYKDNDFKLFRKDAGDQGIRMAEAMYEKDFFNPDELKLVSLPVARSLGPGAFMQILPHDMFLMGVAPEPEAADGFNRPGGDFLLHDHRHASSIYTKRKIYEKQHNIGPEQKAKLEVMQSVWKSEMATEKKNIESKELRYAIGFLGFNHHHDRGIPQLPSSFLAEKPGNVSRALHLALSVSGQPIGFDNPKQTLNEAYDWLREFWLARLPQEEAVLAVSSPEFGKAVEASAKQTVSVHPAAPTVLTESSLS